MRIVKYIICFFIAGCGHFTAHSDITTILNAKVGKSYIPNIEEKLINESGKYQEYQFRATKNCSWIIKVNKSTGIVESWEYSSEEESCKEGVGSYG